MFGLHTTHNESLEKKENTSPTHLHNLMLNENLILVLMCLSKGVFVVFIQKNYLQSSVKHFVWHFNAPNQQYCCLRT